MGVEGLSLLRKFFKENRDLSSMAYTPRGSDIRAAISYGIRYGREQVVECARFMSADQDFGFYLASRAKDQETPPSGLTQRLGEILEWTSKPRTLARVPFHALRNRLDSSSYRPRRR